MGEHRAGVEERLDRLEESVEKLKRTIERLFVLIQALDSDLDDVEAVVQP
jgi:hypothetical protein